ncbi:MAG: phosphoribosylpyrophosphate synthetase [Bacteroidota bacterium]
MYNYDTVTEAVNDLSKRGYTYNFNLSDDCIECKTHDVNLKPDEFHIDEIHRFEGNTDPADETIVYAISSVKHKLKGILVNAFGVYSDSVSNELIAKLRAH